MLLVRIEIFDQIVKYDEALTIMYNTHYSRVIKDIDDTCFILEHPPVFTLGKRFGSENLLVHESFLTNKGISINKIDRGGNITYHGPGQVIIYPIINIKELGIGIKKYIWLLEQTVIDFLKEIQISCTRNKLNNGVWFQNKKIASVGVRVKSGVTLHGIAININTDLTPFSWINPCGLSQVSMTSVKEITKKEQHIDNIKKVLARCFKNNFDKINSEFQYGI